MQTVVLLVRYQEVTSTLYKLFADKLPSRRDFWMALYIEKNLSSRWVRTIFLGASEKKLGLLGGRLDEIYLQNCINFVAAQLAAWEQKDISFVQALMVALKVESALLQNSFFSTHDSDASLLKQLLGTLSRSYKSYYLRIRETMDMVK